MGEVKEYDQDDTQKKWATNQNRSWGRPQFYGLEHNEFVVYNEGQSRIRYLIQIVQKTKEEIAKEKASN